MTDTITREQQMKIGVDVMKQLDIYQPYIVGFQKKGDVCFFENYAGFWDYQEEDIINKRHQLEEEYDIVIYAITHEFTEFGELYDFLYVSKYLEDARHTIDSTDNGTHYVQAYVWNVDDDDYCSEFGEICVRSFGGGIKRVG